MGKVASSIQFTNILEILSLYFHISLHLVLKKRINKYLDGNNI